MPTTKKPKLTFFHKYWPVGVVILFGALLLTSKLTRQKLTLMPSPTPNSTTEISNWKTYTDQDLKFEFNYPSNWTFQKEQLTPYHLSRYKGLIDKK